MRSRDKVRLDELVAGWSTMNLMTTVRALWTGGVSVWRMCTMVSGEVVEKPYDLSCDYTPPNHVAYAQGTFTDTFQFCVGAITGGEIRRSRPHGH